MLGPRRHSVQKLPVVNTCRINDPSKCRDCDSGNHPWRPPLCLVCGCFDALPTHCPGYELDQEQRRLIRWGKLDYLNGRWVMYLPIPELEVETWP